MAVKLVLDGALLAECEMQGANRNGMLRVAEELSKRFVKNKDLDLSVANTIYMNRYNKALESIIASDYPSLSGKIISGSVPAFSNLLKWKGTYFKHFNKWPSVSIKGLENNDVFHSFYYPFPKNVTKKKIRRSISFLDIIPLRESGYDPFQVLLTQMIVKDIETNYAISISEYSKQDLLDYSKKVSADRVFVVPLAASEELFYQNKREADWQVVKNKYGLPDNYFLSVSSRDKRKNVPHLIKSFSKFILQQKPEDISLVLTGNVNYSNSILDELNIAAEVRSKIVIANKFIANEDLAVLYSNASCFFFMSRYEGFGLPALEAMQCGIPVVTSNATSLPEVVGSAGVMLHPDDEDGLAAAMNNIYSDSALRAVYAASSLKKAKEFSWERTANAYVEIFKQLK